MSSAPRFDAKWQNRRGRKRWWRRWRWLVGAAIIAALSLAVHLSGIAGGEWDAVERQFTICGERGAPACVVDGDTLAIGQRRIRLTGYDAPELDGECDAERRLAKVAREELAAWLNLGPFEMEGGAEPPLDRYGRELRSIRRGGELLADTMVDRELARRSRLDRGWC